MVQPDLNLSANTTAAVPASEGKATYYPQQTWPLPRLQLLTS